MGVSEVKIADASGFSSGDRIFDFPIDFSMGLTTVQRYCAACDDDAVATNRR